MLGGRASGVRATKEAVQEVVRSHSEVRMAWTTQVASAVSA
jgi:hypothetical protein